MALTRGQPLGSGRLAPRRRRLAELLVLIGILSLAVSICLPFFATYHGCGGRPSTSSNLRMIAQVAVVYAYEHPQGHFPDSIQDLVSAQAESLHPSTFIVPGGDETAAKTFDQMFGEPGHISFVWVGRGLTLQNITEETVTAYQARSTRQDGQVWVAFADGTTCRLTVAELQDRLRATADLIAGELPRLPDVGRTVTAPPAGAASPE